MFCLRYYPFQDYMQKADELKISYHPADRTLPQFLTKYKDKNIIIDVTDHFEEIDAQLLSSCSEKYKNIKIIFNFNNKDYLSRAQAFNIPFFFTNAVTSIDQLNGLLKYHPTDMYICEELGFKLNKISALLHENHIKVRVFPNVCQSSFPETPSIKTFFIRPEDINIYSAFVDVFELITDKDHQRTLFKIYKQGKWFGKIKEIIPSFKDDNLDSKYLLNTFGLIRSSCGKRCMYDPKSCTICDRFLDVGEVFKKNKIVIHNAKKKN